MDGLLVIDKPGGITSRDAVNQVQRLLPRKTKIGHTGTLDPLATGVLVFCIGQATKLADKVQAMGKCYETRIRFGAVSTTDDVDGVVSFNESVTPPTLEAIREAMTAFVGAISQTPPAFSAVKVGGRRAHDMARRGMSVPLEPRIVQVRSIDILKYEWPWLDLAIDCGKGTYIRSIARDLGAALHVGGLVETLRRTRVGPFVAEAGLKLPTTVELIQSEIILIDRLASVFGFDHNSFALFEG
ncbi:hypothetical protein BH11PLA2_BH11PLA2_41760 [soil metagenome]